MINTKALITKYLKLNLFMQNSELLLLNLLVCLEFKILANKLTLNINISAIFNNIIFARI